MRFKNEDNDLKLYAVAGNQTVLLSFDIKKSLIANANFLGFHIERRDKDDPNGIPVVLNGSKNFKSLINDPTISDPKIKFRSLVQSYFWKDYTADADREYVYTVKVMTGKPIAPVAKFEVSLEVRTEPQKLGEHSVFFNYGVTGSQGYSKRFGDKKIDELPPDVQERALNYLGRELWNEGLLKFVRQADGDRYSLHCAFYEFEYGPFVEEIKAAADRGVNVEVVYADKHGHEENLEAIQKAGLSLDICHSRTKVNQAHNKFMVLSKDGVPKQVWTGSTNITLAGIFGHSNTGHWIVNTAVAKDFKRYWDAIKDDPSKAAVAAETEAIEPNSDLTKLSKGTHVFFSPRDQKTPKGTKPQHLINYGNLIDNAKELVCMIFPFNFDDVFKAVYSKDKTYLRLLLFERSSSADMVSSNDTDLKVTAGAVLDMPVERWVKEITAKKTTKAGILYVHNKFFIIDPLSENPVVVTGSANFSASSITSNDENTMIIKGDLRVADIYLTEFNRLFEHFWPRYLKKKNPAGSKKKGFNVSLDEEYKWFNDYYEKGKYAHSRKMMFVKMKGAESN